jgi:hypothetical protein
MKVTAMVLLDYYTTLSRLFKRRLKDPPYNFTVDEADKNTLNSFN